MAKALAQSGGLLRKMTSMFRKKEVWHEVDTVDRPRRRYGSRNHNTKGAFGGCEHLLIQSVEGFVIHLV